MLQKLKAARQRLQETEQVNGADVPAAAEDRMGLPVAPEKPAPVVRRCGVCGGRDFWQRADGGWLCNVCHPDPRTLKAEQQR